MPNVLSDNMILQRNKTVKLWGKTRAETTVAVEVCGEVYFTFASNGRFEFYIPPHEANGSPFDVIFYTQTAKRTVKNVVFGDVFLMSGQSNMQYYVFMTLEGDQGLHNLESTKYIPSKEKDPNTFSSYEKDSPERNAAIVCGIKQRIKENENIRIGCVDIIAADDKTYLENTCCKEDLGVSWSVATEKTIKNCSTFAYYFAVKMQEILQIPVGVLCNAVGGTFIATWVSAECFNKNESQFKYGNTSSDDNYLNLYSRCYNFYVAPLKDFTFHGVVWYQGEGQHDNYRVTLDLLIKDWRRTFSDPTLPFLIVELPRYGGGDVVPEGYRDMPVTVGTEDYSYYRVREAQRQIARETPFTALSVNIDLGDYDEIHPSDKYPAAVRAALKYLESFYSLTQYKTTPEIVGVRKVSQGEIEIEFEDIGGGLVIKNNSRNIQVSRDGKDYVDAFAELLAKNKIVIRADINILYIRYGYLNYPRISRTDMSEYLSLFTREGYPVDQFTVKIF